MTARLRVRPSAGLVAPAAGQENEEGHEGHDPQPDQEREVVPSHPVADQGADTGEQLSGSVDPGACNVSGAIHHGYLLMLVRAGVNSGGGGAGIDESRAVDTPRVGGSLTARRPLASLKLRA